MRRDIRAQVIGSPNQKLASGLTSGLYVAPIGEYIGPEATRFGVRGFQPPVPFENSQNNLCLRLICWKLTEKKYVHAKNADSEKRSLILFSESEIRMPKLCL